MSVNGFDFLQGMDKVAKALERAGEARVRAAKIAALTKLVTSETTGHYKPYLDELSRELGIYEDDKTG